MNTLAKNDNVQPALNQQNRNNTLTAIITQLPVFKEDFFSERKTSEDSFYFHFHHDNDPVVAYSAVSDNQEVLIVHNTSSNEAIEEYVLVDENVNSHTKQMKAIYGYTTGSCIQVFRASRTGADKTFVKLYLQPKQLVILKST